MQATGVREDGGRTDVPVLAIGPGAPADGLRAERFADLRPAMLELVQIAGGTGTTIGEGLVDRVAREAEQSDLVWGDSPETLSPLGSAGQPGQDDAEIPADDVFPGDGFDPESIVAGIPVPGGDDGAGSDGDVVVEPYVAGAEWPGVQVSIAESGWTAAAEFAPWGYVAVVPAGVTDLDLDLSTEIVGLEAAGVGGELDLLWRTYEGDGTRVSDALSAVGRTIRINMQYVRRPKLLVARIARHISGGELGRQKDPMWQPRLKDARHNDRYTALDCPDISYVAVKKDERAAVVAVHGTMSCAIPLAKALRGALDGARVRTRVLRYEHDTWRTIAANADALATRLHGLGLAEVLLVGHSRGGLVARVAAAHLASAGVDARVLTLGAPFGGTPLVGLVETGRRAAVSLVDFLGHAGGPGLSIAVRVLLRDLRRDLPEGVRELRVGSGTLGLLAALAPVSVTAVAGDADPTGSGDSYGPAEVYFDGPNDRIVAVASAHAVDGDLRDVRCDHFSFASDRDVLAAVVELAPT